VDELIVEGVDPIGGDEVDETMGAEDVGGAIGGAMDDEGADEAIDDDEATEEDGMVEATGAGVATGPVVLT